MADKSIPELINLALRKIPAVREYQGTETRMTATIEHISSSLVYSLVIGLVSLKFPLAIFLNIPACGFYAFYKELVLDKDKNKDLPQGSVVAQVLERSVGFVIGSLITGLISFF